MLERPGSERDAPMRVIAATDGLVYAIAALGFATAIYLAVGWWR